MRAKDSFLRKIEPLQETSSFILWLQLEASGEVTYIHDRLTHQFDSLVHYLDKHPNVFEVFDCGKVKDIREAAGGSAPFPLREKFLNECLSELAKDFYTNIPVILLRVVDLKDGDYLGGVYYKGLFPNMDYESHAVFLYVDRQNRIRGFNSNLIKYSGRPDGGPGALLNRNVEEIISPAPADLQKLFLKQVIKDARDWRLCFDLAEADKEKPPLPLDWHNRHPSELEFITLQKTLDTRKNDLKFEVIAETARGSGPLLLLGSGNTGLFGPDAGAYLFGNLFLSDGYVLKKGGNKVAFLNTRKTSGRVVYTLNKIGRALVCQVNGRTVLEYYDEDFNFNPAACFYIGARAQSANRILGVKIYTCETGADVRTGRDAGPVAKTLARPHRYFQLTRLFNPVLNVVHGLYSDIDCYMLTDITHFRKAIDRFKADYAAEKKQSQQLRKVIDEIRQQDGEFAGSSKFVLEIKEKARAIADYAAPVLIEGPTGTGKEVLSRYIHQQSGRRGHPLVKVDCSALPPNLIESELFGHEKGAFTGAIDRKIGKFEQADKGTLFLDEIGNLTREIQAKLLGVLQDHTITRIGGTRSIKLDIRIIAATNVSLEKLTRSGGFREDLYYRINAITIFLPPLKDRLEDLPALCSRFLSQLNAGNEKKIKDLTPAAYKKLYQYSFPGNIRELRNIIHQAFIFCEDEFIDGRDIQLVPEAAQTARTGAASGKKYILKRMEKAEMEFLLAKHKGVVQVVADELGVTRQACYYFIERKKITLESFRSAADA